MIKNLLKKQFKKLANLIGDEISVRTKEIEDNRLIALGTILSNQQWSLNSTNLNDYEFKIFSQYGDDGIIQYLIKHLKIINHTFIEFGVEDFSESNSRFLMMNNNWSGFIMDGSTEHMNNLKKQHWYWKYNLRHKVAFIDRDNINTLLSASGFNEVGLFHIDLDGNDYFILKALDFFKLNPAILILEYNSVFGCERAISVPYDQNFIRTHAHYSNLFFGASLPALHLAATEKGYALIGCALNGHNAYYVRRDLLNLKVQERSLADAYIESNFRESRDELYNLSYLSGTERLKAIKGLTVFNVITQELEEL